MMSQPANKVFYAAGPGDAISAHKHWKSGKSDPSQFSITFSNQVEDYCLETNSELFLVSHNSREDEIFDGNFRIQHSPKLLNNSSGALYHLREIIYAISLIVKIIRYKPDVFIVDNSNLYQFLFTFIRLFSIKIISVLHCTLWPKGFRPTKGIHSFLLR